MMRFWGSVVGTLSAFGFALGAMQAQASQLPAAQSAASNQRQFLDRYCAACHNDRLKTGGMSLEHVEVARPDAQPEIWEKVVHKLRTGVMPPANMPQPPKIDRLAMATWLENSLDAAWAAKPNPGRTETLRRLNRTEYQNAIRDLLALDIDAASLLPADESGRGFDNVIVGDLSPTLLSRYISAAQKISSLAVGRTPSSLRNDIIRLPADLSQEEQMPGLPIGTRGGVSVPYTFPQDGEYEIQIWLMRDLAGSVGGFRENRPHELLVLIDREQVGSFTIRKPATPDEDTTIDKNLKLRVPVHAGPHSVAVTFVKDGSSLIETARQPTQSRFNERRHPRTAPAISQVSVTGPYAAAGAVDTPSRRRLFVCRPAGQDKELEEKCAREILSTLMRRAYRRPIAKAEVDEPMTFYREGRAEAEGASPIGRSLNERQFDAGIERALSSVLTNPDFLFRVESDPRDLKRIAANGAYRISDLELASRLSFFLWSSVPDDELLDAAVRGKLTQPGELEKQAGRMLSDRRSFNLATNFA